MRGISPQFSRDQLPEEALDAESWPKRLTE